MLKGKGLLQYDAELLRWLHHFTDSRDCRWVIWLSRTGDGYLYLLVGVALWCLDGSHGELFFYTALMAYSLEVPIYIALKQWFKRPRPSDFLSNFSARITPSDRFSLPSGHTAAAWLMASIVASFYPTLALIAYSWAGLIGMSRILLGVHYPSDVLAGMGLGIAIAWLSMTVLG